jgi:hypothetical protein
VYFFRRVKEYNQHLKLLDRLTYTSALYIGHPNNVTRSIPGYVGHIYTVDVCSYLFGLSTPSWSIDSIVTDDTSYSHIKKAVASSS